MSLYKAVFQLYTNRFWGVRLYPSILLSFIVRPLSCQSIGINWIY
jgi:hypothetical protein